MNVRRNKCIFLSVKGLFFGHTEYTFGHVECFDVASVHVQGRAGVSSLLPFRWRITRIESLFQSPSVSKIRNEPLFIVSGRSEKL